jgi:hypothetical protein
MRYVCGVVLFCLIAGAAWEQRTISGIVIDNAGKPIEAARIDHAGGRGGHRTDQQGQFEFETSAPVVVIRKGGFQSVVLRTEGANQAQIVLDQAHPIGNCSADFAPHADVTTSQDIDYVSTTYTLDTNRGRVALVCGRGPLWSSGMPDDRLVWESVEYAETMPADRPRRIDARGKTGDGKYWRYRGEFGDSCAYSKVDQTAAAELDCLLDKRAQK